MVHSLVVEAGRCVKLYIATLNGDPEWTIGFPESRRSKIHSSLAGSGLGKIAIRAKLEIFDPMPAPENLIVMVLSNLVTPLPPYKKSDKRNIADLATPMPVNGSIESSALRQQVCGVKVFARFERT